MVIERGQIWWADLNEPSGSEPGFRRPIVIMQSDAFNRSRLQTVVGVVLTSNLRLVEAPGNVLVPAKTAGLAKDAVANVSQIITIDRDFLSEPRAGSGPAAQGYRKRTPARSRPVVSTGCQLLTFGSGARCERRRCASGAARPRECRSIRALQASPLNL